MRSRSPDSRNPETAVPSHSALVMSGTKSARPKASASGVSIGAIMKLRGADEIHRQREDEQQQSAGMASVTRANAKGKRDNVET
jgi:hypothetical protein